MSQMWVCFTLPWALWVVLQHLLLSLSLDFSFGSVVFVILVVRG